MHSKATREKSSGSILGIWIDNEAHDVPAMLFLGACRRVDFLPGDITATARNVQGVTGNLAP